MKKLLISCAVAALGAGVLFGPVFAQDAMSPSTPSTGQPTPQTAPSSPSAPSAMRNDLTGQTVYTEKGGKIGTVSSMATDAQDQQQAVVSIEKFLGLGGKNVLFPVSSLSPKAGGGYTTSLSSTAIKKLPKATPAGGSD